MNPREIAKKRAEVMMHFANGGEVECNSYGLSGGWVKTEVPNWGWSVFDYRIAEPKPKWEPKAGEVCEFWDDEISKAKISHFSCLNRSVSEPYIDEHGATFRNCRPYIQELKWYDVSKDGEVPLVYDGPCLLKFSDRHLPGYCFGAFDDGWFGKNVEEFCPLTREEHLKFLGFGVETT